MAFFFFTDQVLNAYVVGPYPIRIYVFVFFLGLSVTLLPKRKISVQPTLKLFFGLYFLYFSLWLLGLYMNGGIYIENVSKLILSRYAIVFYVMGAMVLFLSDAKKYKGFAYFLIFFGVINAIFTLLQFFKVDLVWHFTTMFKTSQTYIGGGRYLYGVDKVMTLPNGFSTYAVSNGYFLCGLFPTLYYFLYKKKIGMYIGLSLIYIGAGFFLQQRTAFALTILSFVIGLIYLSKYKLIPILIIGILTSLVYFGYEQFVDAISSSSDTHDLRKLEKGAKDQGRAFVYLLTFEFLKDHFMWGGLHKFLNYYPFGMKEYTPHNLFLNAWVYCGFPGFLVMVVMVFVMLKKFVSNIWRYRINKNIFSLMFSMCAFNFIMNSLTHNQGFASGDALVWYLVIMAIMGSKYGTVN